MTNAWHVTEGISLMNLPLNALLVISSSLAVLNVLPITASEVNKVTIWSMEIVLVTISPFLSVLKDQESHALNVTLTSFSEMAPVFVTSNSPFKTTSANSALKL